MNLLSSNVYEITKSFRFFLFRTSQAFGIKNLNEKEGKMMNKSSNIWKIRI